MTELLTLYVAAGALLVALAIPLILRKIRPNALYGFRVAPVFDSDDIWYAANRYAGKWLAAAGAAILAAAVGFYFLPGLTVDLYALACLAAFLLVLVPGLIFSLRFARAMARTKR